MAAKPQYSEATQEFRQKLELPYNRIALGLRGSARS